MKGAFILPKRNLIIPNLIVQEGAISFLKMMFRADVADVAAGGNFFFGLAGETGVAANSQLNDITDELTVVNGYARKPISRDAIGWPTVDLVNGQGRAKSAIANFTAAGGDFSAPFSRVFLCNVVSGSIGLLYAFSAQISPAITATDGNTEPIQYEFFF